MPPKKSMKAFFEGIREKKNTALIQKIITAIAIFASGIALGVLSKFLDGVSSGTLPAIFECLDIRNFFGRFAIWLFIALCISVYSRSAACAAVNVFIFFVGMVLSYYMYSWFVAGFFPKSYALVWVVFTAISPILAFVCWYAKGRGKISLGLSSIIIAVLFNASFVYGWFYFDVRSVLEAIIFICSLVVLRRPMFKDTAVMIAVGILAALIINLIVPFNFG